MSFLDFSQRSLMFCCAIKSVNQSLRKMPVSPAYHLLRRFLVLSFY